MKLITTYFESQGIDPKILEDLILIEDDRTNIVFKLYKNKIVLSGPLSPAVQYFDESLFKKHAQFAPFYPDSKIPESSRPEYTEFVTELRFWMSVHDRLSIGAVSCNSAIEGER